jgi:hypothetical protein
MDMQEPKNFSPPQVQEIKKASKIPENSSINAQLVQNKARADALLNKILNSQTVYVSNTARRIWV